MSVTELENTTVVSKPGTWIRHIYGWEEGKALCGKEIDTTQPPNRFPSLLDPRCIICDDLWEHFPPSLKSALRQRWGME